MRLFPLLFDPNEMMRQIKGIGCDERSWEIFDEKRSIFPIKITQVGATTANIIKQEMISCKGDAVLHRHSISGKVKTTDIILLGTRHIYREFIQKIKEQRSNQLTLIAERLTEILYHSFEPLPKLTLGNRTLNWDKPVIMGILNLTEDSFYDGGRYQKIEDATAHCKEMITEGASIIDIGGESSRPGAKPVPLEVELKRVIPVVKEVVRRFETIISIDTTKSEVAEAALKAGAHIINDISGLRFDPRMAEVCSENECGVIIMHMKGTPADMQINPSYDDVIGELIDYFEERIEYAVSKGIQRNKLIIDPGFGFGKRVEDNLNIIRGLGAFRMFGLPILIGASRKSTIGKLLDAQPEERLVGTLAIHIAAYINGANIFRVHDVKPHYDALKIVENLLK